MIAFYLKKAERRFQEGFLEIVKWVRLVCPHHSIRLFYHPPDGLGLEKLREVETLPVSTLPSLDGHQLLDAVARTLSGFSPGIILWGPDPIDGPLMRAFDGLPFSTAFSTHLQFRVGQKGKKRESTLTLIHGDPKPMEPTLDSTIPEGDDRIFTGFITTDHGERNAIQPIHLRGAEVTANLLKNILYGRSVSSRTFLYPVIAMVEPTRRCNLACPMCPVGSDRTYRPQDMPLERFRKVIDELAPFLIHLTLHNYGESFLHRDIYHMIEYAKREGIPDVNVSTNGHFLDPSRLVDSGLDEIMISLDGVTQETYAKYRRGGKLEKVIENIRGLDEEKKKRQTEKPLIELQFIIMKHNQDQMDRFRKLAAELGAERIRFKTFNLQMSGPEACEMGVEFLPTHAEYTRYEDTRGQVLKRHLEENRCKWPWERVVINSDGHVVPCCNDFNSFYSMGNVFEQSFHEIWFGTKYNRFRKSILKRWRKIPLCASCPVPSRANLSFERMERTQRQYPSDSKWQTTKY